MSDLALSGTLPRLACVEKAGREEWRAPAEQLVLDLDGYEGPIDLLLSLAREQKVDLAKISILALADQYLAFIDRQQQLRLEIAADYLVMAAWLAYLKSRLLLPATAAGRRAGGSRDRRRAGASPQAPRGDADRRPKADGPPAPRPRLVFARRPRRAGDGGRCRFGGSIFTSCCAPMATAAGGAPRRC